MLGAIDNRCVPAMMNEVVAMNGSRQTGGVVPGRHPAAGPIFFMQWPGGSLPADGRPLVSCRLLSGTFHVRCGETMLFAGGDVDLGWRLEEV